MSIPDVSELLRDLDAAATAEVVHGEIVSSIEQHRGYAELVTVYRLGFLTHEKRLDLGTGSARSLLGAVTLHFHVFAADVRNRQSRALTAWEGAPRG